MSKNDHNKANEHRRIRASTIIFSAATALSRVAGLLREILTSFVFGASASYSAFVVANQIPNLLRSLVADSALSAAFVPVFTHMRENNEEERAWRVASGVCAVIVMILGPLTVAAMIAAPWIVGPFVEQGNFTAHDVELAIGLTRLLLPIVLILSLSGVIVGILNSYDRFGLAALAPVAWNAVILLSLVGAHWFAAESMQIWIYAIGTLAGTVVQAVLPMPHLRGLGHRLSLRVKLRDPKVREVFILMLPVTISLGLINLQQLLSSLFAANVDASLLIHGVEAGAGPALLDKAFRIYMLPQGIFSVAVTTVIFPVLSRMVAREDDKGFAEAVDKGLRQILILLVPSSIFLGAFATPITRTLYQGGDFDSAQTIGVALSLIAFSIGLTFNGLSLLLIRSFFAMRDTWVPTIVSAITLVANVLIAITTYRAGGVFAIALATSIANVIGVILLYGLLHKRISVSLGTARTITIALGTVTSSVIAVGIPFIIWQVYIDQIGASKLAALAIVSVSLCVAAPVYLRIGAKLGVIPKGMISQLLRRKV